ncbi:MAG: crosslink repair DNA glycosylase YcaQ family protein [Vicinamibacterales bacterium]
MSLTVHDLRRFAVARSLFPATTLGRAVDVFGFVQADPIRAPARAQDLTLRHRVSGYRAGDLERHYASLGIEEDVFVNYGFVTRAVQAHMHPRRGSWTASQRKRVAAILDFVRARGTAHPRDVDVHFAHGTITNYWGGSSNATTRLLELMHYHGLLRVVRRDVGIRVYGAQQLAQPADGPTDRIERLDALVDVAVHTYAPLPGANLSNLIARLRYAVPHWRPHLTRALQRARQRLAHAQVDGIDWYWPSGEPTNIETTADRVRLLAPFDPVVWDRRRFEMFWGWAYRFEAYTPLAKRVRGYYALPLLWRDRVIGWANVSVNRSALHVDAGYVTGRAPRDAAFKPALEEELEAMRHFLGITPHDPESAG